MTHSPRLVPLSLRSLRRAWHLGCAMALALVALTSVAAAQPADPPRPNIVVIVADDLGWDDVGYHNDDIRTPALDGLARSGVRLDWHYVMPQCTPTRVALMTGRYPSRFGPHACRASNDQAFPLGTPTMASVLKQAGYQTALCGKWHMGSKPEWGPNHYGFDYSYGSLAGAVGMFDHRYRLGTPYARTWHRNHRFIDEVGHATDLVTADAIQLLQAERDAPLFLYVPFQAVHTPLVETGKWIRRNNHIQRYDRRLYAAAVTHMDDCIRQIVEASKPAPNGRQTLLLFFSDNGAQVDHTGNTYPPPDPPLRNFSSNKPLRSSKTHVYEGGMRVPALIYWPEQLAPSICEAPMHAVDWLPTLAHLAGAALPGDLEPDGQDVWPLLQGQVPHDRELYWVWGDRRNRVALRYGPWKVLRDGPQKAWELYHLGDDPYEQHDLANSEPEKLEAMLERIRTQRLRDAE